MAHARLTVRALAFLLDTLLLGLVALPATVMAAMLRLLGTPSGPLAGSVMLEVLGRPVSISFLIGSFMYWVVSEATWGATLGKRALGLRVRAENGAPISWLQAVVRRLSLLPPLLLIDALVALITPRRQRALDLVAGTVVVRI